MNRDEKHPWGVFVKWMNMPNCCYKCPLCDRDYYCAILHKAIGLDNIKNNRLEDCPIAYERIIVDGGGPADNEGYIPITGGQNEHNN